MVTYSVLSEGIKHMNSMASLITEIRNDVRRTRHFVGKDALDEEVLSALTRVPRQEFVPDSLRDFAYENRPLSIGHGQTISQPYIVALMTDMLAIKPAHRVLEVGTGSGYQSAVLAEMGAEVYTLEVVAELSSAAQNRLVRLGYREIYYRVGDGYQGWPEEAPYDSIIVTAAAPFLPEALVEQLRPAGRMAIPIGQPHSNQNLIQVVKDVQGRATMTKVLPVVFVPMVSWP